jgi:5-methylcytosine-specific restriction enzyme A
MSAVKPMFTHGQLYSYKWQKRARLQLMQEPCCRLCAQEGRVTAAEVVDHIEPHKGDINKFYGPLQSLCKWHHDSVKQQMERQIERNGFSFSKQIGEDGFPVDKAHPFYRGANK